MSEITKSPFRVQYPRVWVSEQQMTIGARADLVRWLRAEAKRRRCPQGQIVDELVRPSMSIPAHVLEYVRWCQREDPTEEGRQALQWLESKGVVQ